VGGRIKLGVADRVNLLADYEEPVHPLHRPPYLHIIPLAEIIALALGHKSVTTAGVQKSWSELTQSRTEIEVLMEADLADLKAEPRVVESIQNFRMGRVEVMPGGGASTVRSGWRNLLGQAGKKMVRGRSSTFEWNGCS
jgi:PHP family Zn ribbon phosphoesterase